MRSADVDFGSIPFSCTTNEQTVCEADNKAPRVRVYAFIARENQATLEGGFNMKNYLKRFVTAASLPKFEAEYSVEMKNVLKSMGMTTAFDSGQADFSGIGFSSDGNLYISDVIHKTFIAVDEQGTKAGAATLVEVCTESASIDIAEPIYITLDRPFLYMIIDCKESLPVFIGTVMEP